MKHLFVDISGHGFGHLAQISTVVNKLHQYADEIRVTIRTSLPAQIVRSKIHADFNLLACELDKGMMMHDAMSVDVKASYGWYESFHEDYARRVDQERQKLQRLAPDLLLADVPYLSLEAAHAAGIPSLALCSLNWADIFHAYCKDYPRAEQIYAQISQAYARAEQFLCPAPSMDMPAIHNTRAIAPLALKGERQRQVLLQMAGTTDKTRFVLISLGGIDSGVDLYALPVMENIHWIAPGGARLKRKDVHDISEAGLSYIDMLASADLMITKTGYGALVEAAAHQVPIICISRPEWPEEPALFTWSRKHGYFAAIERHEFGGKKMQGRIHEMLEQPWEKAPLLCNGDAEAAEILLRHLRKQAGS